MGWHVVSSTKEHQMRKLLIGLVAVLSVMTVVFTGTSVQASPLTIRSGRAPGIMFDALTLEQQMLTIDVHRPPIILPVQFSTGRTVPMSPMPLPSAQVESLIQQYFQPADWEWALRVSYCESNWVSNAANPTSTARGLFQPLKGWWGGEWGYPAFDPFDPVANTRFAAWLYYEGGPSHWNASRSCWG